MCEGERIYAICTVLFALVTFSSLVSAITNTLTYIRKKNFERTEQMDLIRRYITEKKVSVDVGNRIYTCFKYKSNRNRATLHASDVPALQTLPETLSRRLSAEIFLPVMLPHPMFHHYHEVNLDGIQHICHSGVSELSVMTAESVFTFRDTCSKMFFLVKGALVYTDATPAGNLRTTKLKRGAVFCEMPLWVIWTHRGRMSAHRSSELVLLDCNAFHHVTLHRGCFQQCREYAAFYLERLQLADGCGQEGSSPPTDIWYDFDVTQDMVHKAFGTPVSSKSVGKEKSRFSKTKTKTKNYLGMLRRAAESGFSSFSTNHSGSRSTNRQSQCSCFCRRRPKGLAVV